MPRQRIPRNAEEVRRALLSWAAGHRRDFPWRAPGLSQYDVLVAEVLLKRTTARAAARAFAPFLAQFPDLESLRSSPSRQIERALEHVGLYRQRAKGLKEMAEYMIREHQGRVPDKLAGLLRVPHLGPYTARAILSFGHRRPAAIVDSNVIRVYRRVYGRRLGKSPSLSTMQTLADLVLDPANHREFNWALLDLGAMVCRYDGPLCVKCPLSDLCDYAKRHRRAKGYILRP